MSRIYQICTNCIMDTTDPNITFDTNGVCDYCKNFYNNILPNWNTDHVGYEFLKKISNKIKSNGLNKSYDCIIGLSGGLDSSYALYVAKEIMGLRPLVFHVDAGWNTQQAVSNIEKVVDGLGLDLYTEVINWEEMKDLQVAFLKSQIADQDLPQDYAFFSSLYKYARKNGIKYIITGSNFSTESCREPEQWGGYAGIDKTLVKDIHKKFGSRYLNTFPLIDVFTYKIIYKYFYGMQVIKPLNYVNFNKNNAEELLNKRFSWEPFQHKHHESRFTRFYEDYWLPKKFGYDKRKAHFSSLIISNQMNRNIALERIKKSELNEDFLMHEFKFIANKLELTVDELQEIFNGNNKTYKDYNSKKKYINFATKIMVYLGLEKKFYR